MTQTKKAGIIERWWRDFEVSGKFALSTHFHPRRVPDGDAYTAHIISTTEPGSWRATGRTEDEARGKAAELADKALEPHPSWKVKAQ